MRADLIERLRKRADDDEPDFTDADVGLMREAAAALSVAAEPEPVAFTLRTEISEETREALKAAYDNIRDAAQPGQRFSDAIHSAIALIGALTSKDVAEVAIAELKWCLALSEVQVPGGTFAIDHDGFEGTMQGHYVTREGKRGVVLQQIGTKVVHVYGVKWLKPSERDATHGPDL